MRSIRLPGRDYSAPGTYFVTICSADRKIIFGSVKDGIAVENTLGQFVRARWLEIPRHFANVELGAFMVMPNHLHGLIHLASLPGAAHLHNREEFGKPTPASLPTIVRTFKAAVTRDARHLTGTAGADIWQRNYFERVIRDDHEYADTWRYISDNPMRWEMDEKYPENILKR